jgi:hypothetical protein
MDLNNLKCPSSCDLFHVDCQTYGKICTTVFTRSPSTNYYFVTTRILYKIVFLINLENVMNAISNFD